MNLIQVIVLLMQFSLSAVTNNVLVCYAVRVPCVLKKSIQFLTLVV